MILDQLVSVKISNQGKYYKNLGYLETKQGAILDVNWQHLPKNSNKELRCLCDVCNSEFIRNLQLLNRQSEHLCYDCARSKVKFIE